MKIKIYIFNLILIVAFLAINTTNVYASENISLSGNRSLTVGSSETITVKLSNNSKGKVVISCSDPSVISLEKSAVFCKPNATFTVQALKEGTATIKVKCDDVSDSTGDNEIMGEDSIKITVKPTNTTQEIDEEEKNLPTETTKTTTDTSASKSRNNYLSSLKVSDGTLSPEFNRDITSYTINFDDENTIKNLDKIKITATADDKTAKVTGTGEKALVEGENTFKINVKSESGSTRTYVIKVTKPATIKESDLRLSSLKVQTVDNEGNSADAELDKAFDKETLEYSMNVESNISGLNVTAIPATTDIDVSVSGNENLHDGMNEVVITLTSKEDQTVQTTYKITVNKAQSTLLINESNQESLENNNSRRNKMIALIICCVIFVVIILLIIWYKKGKHSTISKEKFEKNMNHNFVDDDDVIVDDFEETEESSIDERKHKKNKKGKHEEQESDLESSREESKNNEKEDKNNLNQKLEVQKGKDKEEGTAKDNKKNLEDKSEIKKNTKTENKENKKNESKNDLDKKFDVKTKQKKNGGKHF